MYKVYEQKTKDSEKLLLATFIKKESAVAFLRARTEYYLFNSDEPFPYDLGFEIKD